MSDKPNELHEGRLVENPFPNRNQIIISHYKKIVKVFTDIIGDFPELSDVVQISQPKRKIDIFKDEFPTIVAVLPIDFKINILKAKANRVTIDNLFNKILNLSTSSKALDKLRKQIRKAGEIRVKLLPLSFLLNSELRDLSLQELISMLEQHITTKDPEDKKDTIKDILRFLRANDFISYDKIVDTQKLRSFIIDSLISFNLDIVMKRIEIPEQRPEVATFINDTENYEMFAYRGINTLTALDLEERASRAYNPENIESITSYTYLDRNIEFFRTLVRKVNIFQRPAEGKPEILKMLFREIAKIHAGGLIHGDLHGGNIGIEWDVEGHPIIFIDMSRGGGIENLVGEKRRKIMGEESFDEAVLWDLTIFASHGLKRIKKAMKQTIDEVYLTECIYEYLDIFPIGKGRDSEELRNKIFNRIRANVFAD